MMDSYVYVIMALLPLSALMLVIQTSPYQALVIRGILGAVAALVYAILGGADVALTEALVGTMLSITLFAVAVRSSLVMRLGVLVAPEPSQESLRQSLLAPLRMVLNRYHLRLELVAYPHPEALQQALQAKEVHGICRVDFPLGEETPARVSSTVIAPDLALTAIPSLPSGAESDGSPAAPPRITLRVPRLYEILTTELPPATAQLQTLNGDRTPLTPPLILMEKY
ncbi:DUF4040 domain-containing protein [Synechococcales cyanobacterium C]|uniref:DUF4040 domain-containing protein n=2 Tax=Petrachloros TaxID=2918834 RepID=A0A8K2A259_9CYAN|nr:DUF4040 domain-containing protein [Petrachloros mirabilis]NCJ08476.1 DUF4040 domain-containing protein [Petrachloros mirabilis ULC683]